MSAADPLTILRRAIQMDPGQRGLASHPTDNLFTACPDDFAAACRTIALHPQPKVGIVTGFMIPRDDGPSGETDGPLGALLLAQTLDALDIPCILIADDAAFAALQTGLHSLASRADLQRPGSAAPNVSHLIALERSGPSRSDGRHYTMRGRDITDLTAPVHLWFERPRAFVTIGIGDGGNEIGMGKIPHPTIIKNIPNGARIACRTPTDYLVVAGVSNWGAYAMAAGLMLLRGRPDPTLLDPSLQARLLHELVHQRLLVDGVSGTYTPTVDGLPLDRYLAPLEEMRDLVARSLRT